MKSEEYWLIPMFIVLAIFGGYLLLIALPTSTFGVEWVNIKNELWIFLPWLVVLAVAGYVLYRLASR